MATLTVLEDLQSYQRPPIAHLPRDGSNIGLCGTPMQGKPAPPGVDHCVVCASLEAADKR